MARKWAYQFFSGSNTVGITVIMEATPPDRQRVIVAADVFHGGPNQPMSFAIGIDDFATALNVQSSDSDGIPPLPPARPYVFRPGFAFVVPPGWSFAGLGSVAASNVQMRVVYYDVYYELRCVL